MKAHDVRHLRGCAHCRGLGDKRIMLHVARKPADGDVPRHCMSRDGTKVYLHDLCAVLTISHEDLLMLPLEERNKISVGAAGVELMRKLLSCEV